MKCIYPMFFALFAATAPFAATVNLSTLPGNYEAQDGDVLTGTLEGKSQPYKISIANDAKVTLSDATINGSNSKNFPWAGLTCLGNCTVVLKGSNTVKGFYDEFPGIQAAKNEGAGDEYTLVIEGNGSLDARSSGYGAGIGGGYSDNDAEFGKISCGDIIIKGGIVTAMGGSYAAGIGSGGRGTCGNITISGGEVTATGGPQAAGIGSGNEGTSGAITISGGKVTATGRVWAAGIGSGNGGTSGAITISGGEVEATAGKQAAGVGNGYQGKSGDIIITNDITKVMATKGIDAPYSINVGDGESASTITIGGVVMGPIEKSSFEFPAELVDVETAGSKTVAFIDGNYNGEDALSLTEDVSVDNVIFKRTFPAIDGENNYSTIMFPFEISANKVGNVKQVVSFLGIGIDGTNHKYVAVERVWCNEQSNTKCNYGTAKLEAYKPYLIQLESGKTSISINNTDPLVLKASPTDADAYDVAQNDDYSAYGDFVFRAVVQTKTWDATDPEIEGTAKAAAYGFAGSSATDISIGQFVKVGEGAYIKPFRAYIYKKPVPQSIKGVYGLRQTASIDNDIPDVMNVVIVDRKKDGSEQTTVIGQFNSRTGKIRLNRTTRTYDLNGRSVRDASHMAKGLYLKK